MRNGSRRSVWRRARLAMMAGAFVLVMLELVLQLAALVPPVGALLSKDGVPSIVPDEALGHRRNAALADYDDAGFRNATRLTSSRVVVLGDSQCEGYSVSREHAWPQQLDAAIDGDVYNMAVAGYGPAEYRVLADEALQLEPQTVIVGLYSGNDLANAWRSVWQESRAAMLKPPLDADPAPADLPPLELGTTPRHSVESADASQGLAGLLEEHCKLLGIVRALDRALHGTGAAITLRDDDPDWPWDRLEAEVREAADPDQLMALDLGPDRRTLLTPRFRLRVLDMSDPRIEEGLRLTLVALEQLRDLCRAHHAQLKVALIPTKEWVLAPLADAPADTALGELAVAEAQLWERVRRELSALEIATIDVLPALRAAASEGRFPYRNTDDGHPNAAGNAAIADAVRAAISAE
ncbi:MAG: hypothetical protein AB7K09_03210 [Planctomycetota bacterium]